MPYGYEKYADVRSEVDIKIEFLYWAEIQPNNNKNKFVTVTKTQGFDYGP